VERVFRGSKIRLKCSTILLTVDWKNGYSQLGRSWDASSLHVGSVFQETSDEYPVRQIRPRIKQQLCSIHSKGGAFMLLNGQNHSRFQVKKQFSAISRLQEFFFVF
jgi:hypothetical protein